MAGDDCWSAGVLAGFDIGVLSSAVVLAGGDGERLTATMKNTGASTSAATDWRRLSAVPLRTRLKDTIAGITAMMHNRPPNAAVAGITASAAPRTAMTNVTAPRRLRGGGCCGVLIRWAFLVLLFLASRWPPMLGARVVGHQGGASIPSRRHPMM
jgi:hypothetical protein